MIVNGKLNIFFRAIALVLIVTFILQGVVYADPDIILKSSTLAPRTMFSGENKQESIRRAVAVYFGKFISTEPPISSTQNKSSEHNIYTIELAAAGLRKNLNLSGLSEEDFPKILSEADRGYIRIIFPDEMELLFYYPKLIPPDNSPELLKIVSAGKHISSNERINGYLYKALILPGPRPAEIPSIEKPKVKISPTEEPGIEKSGSYEKRLKYLLKMDDRIDREIRQALAMFYDKKGGASRYEADTNFKIRERVALPLALELKSGLVSKESLRIAIKNIDSILSFAWDRSKQNWWEEDRPSKKLDTNRRRIWLFNRHIKKALAFKAREDKALEGMQKENIAWNTYLLPEGASGQERKLYFEYNIRGVIIYLRSIIENTSDKSSLKKRLLQLFEKISDWRSLKDDTARGDVLKSSARAFYALSKIDAGKIGTNTVLGFNHIAKRCSMLASILEYPEVELPYVADISKLESGGQIERGLLTANGPSFGATFVGMLVPMFTGAALCAIVASNIAGLSMYNTAIAAVVTMASYAFVMLSLQKMQLKYYLRNGINLQNNIKDSDPKEREKIRSLFKDIFGVYRSRLLRDFVQERKELLLKLVLVNIIPPEERGEDERTKGSYVRSDEAMILVMEEILPSEDPNVFQPALEVVIELIAQYPKYCSKRFLPLIEESGKLPHFAKALVDVLIKAEKGGIKMVSLGNIDRFMDEGKDILTDMAERLPKIRNDILAYLVTIAEKSSKEIELVHDLLERIGFFITLTEELPRASATEVASTMIKIRAERKRNNDPRKTINIVFTGGKVMPQFLNYLGKILGKDIWADIHVYQLCEYEFYSPDHTESIAYFINKHLPEALPPANRHLMNGLNMDPGYMKKLDNSGGIDIVVLGIGENGRIGFNEPTNLLDDISGKLKTVQVGNVGVYTGQPRPRGIGYTMGLTDIMKAKNIFLLAEGKSKSKIIKRSLFEPASPMVPASILQEARNLKVILDIDAMGEVTPTYQISFKKMVGRLTKAEMRSRDLFENSPAAQHEINRSGMIILSNAAEARMLGYDSGELVGKYISDIIHPDNRKRAEERIKEKFAKRQENLPEVEARYVTKTGETIWVRINDTQIVDDNGNVTAIQSTLMNITRFKEMEAELISLKAAPITGNGSYKKFDSVAEVERSARHAVSLLANILMSKSVKLKDEKIILALDGSLGPTDDIRGLINKYVIEALSSGSPADGDLEKVFRNLVIVDGDVSAIPIRLNSIIEHSAGKDKGAITKENIVIMTTESNIEYFKDFEGQSLITAVNDADLKTDPGAELNYYPIVELIFFSIARMAISGREDIGGHKEDLWEWYRNIPNIDNIEKGNFEKMIYENDGASLRKTILLKLVPHAVRIDKNEMRNLYERIREFITKA